MSSPPVVAILGGGQLARMLVLAGIPLGVRFAVFDAHADVCAARVAPVTTIAWEDERTLALIAAEAQIATFDYENVPAGSAQWLAQRMRVAPNAQALGTAQDRLAEKTAFQRLGIPTAEFQPVGTRAELDHALREIGAPAILKTRRLGYDGKGQFRLHSAEDADAAWQALGDAAGQQGLILESLVPFDFEVSVVAVRGANGEFRAWPLVRNHHVDGVLSMSTAPAPGVDALAQPAFQHAKRLAEALDYVGVFALELFVQGGRLLANEMAPRVHNSGHWTLDGAITSQFENHLRAILGWPLGDTGTRGLSVMFNWIGELPDPAPFLASPDTHWHDYGKAARPGRKVGHATVCAPDATTMCNRLLALARDPALRDKIAPVLQALQPARPGDAGT